MRPVVIRRPVRSAVPALVGALAVAGLVGCTPTDDPDPTPSAGSSATSRPSPSASPSATAGAPTTVPVDVPCDQLVSAETVYEYDPNFVLLDDAAPEPGSAAARAVADGGVACAWQHTTTSERIVLSVAGYDEATLATLRDDAGSNGTEVTAWATDAGYFATVDGRGIATAFTGPYWMVLSSPVFTEPGEATAFVDSAAAAVR